MARPSTIVKAARPELPGRFVHTDTGEKFYIIDEREDSLFDTVVLGSYGAVLAITAGRTYNWFRTVSTKGAQFTNFETDQEVPAGWYIAITKMGLHFQQELGSLSVAEADIMRVVNNFCVEFTKVDTVKKKAPPIFWQSGHGVAGATAVTGGYRLTMGTPSPAAIPRIKVPFSLKPKDTVKARIFADTVGAGMNDTAAAAYTYPTLNRAVGAMIILHGLILRSGVKD